MMSTLSKMGISLSSHVIWNEGRYDGNNIYGSNDDAYDVDGSGEGHQTPNSILESSLNRSLLPPS